jgi:hypothetical protein
VAVSLAKQASSSTSAAPSGGNAEPTIDLRVEDASWQRRRLQAQVQVARRRLDELEHRGSGDAAALETHLGNTIVDAQNQIARERADARRTAAALMAEAEVESRRRLEVARAEARALLGVAEWLRSQSTVASAGPPADAAGALDAGVVRP